MAGCRARETGIGGPDTLVRPKRGKSAPPTTSAPRPHLELLIENEMEPRISMITLGVADLQRATKFYRDGLGLPADEKNEGVVFFKLKGTWLALFPTPDLAADAQISAEGNGFTRVALAHNVRTKEEVEQVLAQAEAAGAKITKPAQDAFWGGYCGYFCDPDGHVWEVAWNPHFDLT